jgi:hypothetical protein
MTGTPVISLDLACILPKEICYTMASALIIDSNKTAAAKEMRGRPFSTIGVSLPAEKKER